MVDLRLTNEEKEGLKEEEIEIAMVRKLEIQLLPHLRRNIHFFYAGGNLKGKSNAYNQPHSKDEIEKLLNSSESLPTVCKPLCQVVAEVLMDNGVLAETITCDTDIFKHTDLLITTKKGSKYIIDFLEDMELIQTGMKTPDFASKEYYDRRYKKFEGKYTPDGKSVEGIRFLSSDRLDKIDENLGYKKFAMYMDDVIEQLRVEFLDFRDIMARDEILSAGKFLSNEEKNKILNRYKNMSDDEVLEQKLDWIFQFFNRRGNINGHTDFVMYYSRVLLKRILSSNEYGKLDRYDCFVYTNNVPRESPLNNILDLDNQEEVGKCRFCMVRCANCYYVFSTIPDVYIKLNEREIEEIKQYAIVSKSEAPSDLVIHLCNRGNALPLVFHPLGFKLLNERESLIDEKDETKKSEKIEQLAAGIVTTDEPITSMTIPYPNGVSKYVYIDENNEFVVIEGGKKTVYHYNKETDTFDLEEISLCAKKK